MRTILRAAAAGLIVAAALPCAGQAVPHTDEMSVPPVAQMEPLLPPSLRYEVWCYLPENTPADKLAERFRDLRDAGVGCVVLPPAVAEGGATQEALLAAAKTAELLVARVADMTTSAPAWATDDIIVIDPNASVAEFPGMSKDTPTSYTPEVARQILDFLTAADPHGKPSPLARTVRLQTAALRAASRLDGDAVVPPVRQTAVLEVARELSTSTATAEIRQRFRDLDGLASLLAVALPYPPAFELGQLQVLEPGQRPGEELQARRTLLGLRKVTPALRYGRFEILVASDEADTLAFLRVTRGSVALAAVNNSSNRRRIDIPGPVAIVRGAPEGTVLKLKVAGVGSETERTRRQINPPVITITSGTLPLNVPPRTAVLYVSD